MRISQSLLAGARRTAWRTAAALSAFTIAALICLAASPSHAFAQPHKTNAEFFHEGASTRTLPIYQGQAQPMPSNDMHPGKASARNAPVLFIGVNGLRWDAITLLEQNRSFARHFPRVARLLDNAAEANLIVRSKNYRACPADGWLALSSINRIAWKSSATLDGCPSIPAPSPAHNQPGMKLPDWEKVIAPVRHTSAGQYVGMLSTILRSKHIKTTAIGRGAAWALASPNGHLEVPYIPASNDDTLLANSIARAVDDSHVTVVDMTLRTVPPSSIIPSDLAGIVRDNKESQDIVMTVRNLQRIEKILSTVNTRTSLVIASLADGYTASRAQVVAVSASPLTLYGKNAQERWESESGAPRPHQLYSATSRKKGIVLTPNLTMVVPTLALGQPLAVDESVSPESSQPHNVVAAMPVTASAADFHAQLADRARHAAGGRAARGPFTITFVSLVVMTMILVPWTWARRRASALAATASGDDALSPATDQPAPAPFAQIADKPHADILARIGRQRRFMLRFWLVAGLWIAAIPGSAFIANLLPWWRFGPQWTETAGTTLVARALISNWLVAAVIAAVSLLVGRLAKNALAPAITLSAITTAALVIDPIVGSPMPLDSAIATASVFASRFYGVGNTQFAIMTTSALMLSCLVGAMLIGRGKRTTAALFAAAVMLVVIVADGAVWWGADFGGPPATIIGSGILILALLNKRIRGRHLAALVGVATIVPLTVSFVDWLRPPMDRTHLGQFFQAMLDGRAMGVITRKLTSMILADGWQVWQVGLLTVAGLAVLAIAYWPLKSSHTRTEALSWLHPQGRPWRLLHINPCMKPLLLSWSATMFVATLINDSVILIPLIAAGYFVPALASLAAAWLLREDSSRQRA